MLRVFVYVVVLYSVYAVKTGAGVSSKDLCNPSPCGLNTNCVVRPQRGDTRPICTCLDNFFGNPFEECTPECIQDSDCTKNRQCQDNGCRDPCIDGCGEDAFCYVNNHRPVCSCPEFFLGDPHSGCYPDCRNNDDCLDFFDCVQFTCIDPCINKPCGTGADCEVVNHTASCICPTGFNVDENTSCDDETILSLLDEALFTGNVCDTTRCGTNAVCKSGKDQFGKDIPVCSCPPGYFGDRPKVVCRLNLCNHHDDCPEHQSCHEFLCGNPCYDAEGSSCAEFASCDVKNHLVVCSCPEGYTGDPFHRCYYEEPEERPSTEASILEASNVVQKDDLCDPNPCGFRAHCYQGKDHIGTDIPICLCPGGFFGDAKIVCQRKECLANNECPEHQGCYNHLCKDPCTIIECAKFASCTVTKHEPRCSCPRGYQGNPLEECRYSPEQPSTTEAPADPKSLGFTLVNGKWLIGSDGESKFADSVRWCSDHNAEMFIPRTSRDEDYYEKFRLSTKEKVVWYPITDVETENHFKWADGTSLTKQDEERINWEGVGGNTGRPPFEVYFRNNQDSDCGLLASGGVYIQICDWKDLPYAWPALCSLKT